MTEAAFQHKVWQPKLDDLRDIAIIKIIYCEVNSDIAKVRFIERGTADPDRAKFHDDMGIQPDTDISDTLLAKHDPPCLDVPMLTIDTSDGYQPSFDEIISFIGMSN